MRFGICKLITFFILLKFIDIFAISMVYNFRIAQITKRQIHEKTRDNHYTAIALAFNEYLQKYDGIQENFPGGLAAFIYDFGKNYFRTDFAFSHIKEIMEHKTTFSGTKTDDLLFTLGHNFKINNSLPMTFSGLLGIPTHKINRLRHVDFGYGQVGLGAQFDGMYKFNDTNDFLYGLRYLYFIPRFACNSLCNKYKFTIGNIADMLLGYKHDWDKHGLELGYTFRANFGAHIYPNITDLTSKINYIRNNYYLVYKYKFFIKEAANRLLFDISYGSDARPKKFGNKHIITAWVSWTVRF